MAACFPSPAPPPPPPSHPCTKNLFSVFLSFQPDTVAISSFHPSSSTPTSWLTQFCSEVTDFLANLQRVALTPALLPATVLPCRRRHHQWYGVVLTVSVLHTNGLFQWHGWLAAWGDVQPKRPCSGPTALQPAARSSPSACPASPWLPRPASVHAFLTCACKALCLLGRVDPDWETEPYGRAVSPQKRC